MPPIQPVEDLDKPTGEISNDTECKALVPYVRTSSVATKIIIGIPKSGSRELVPKPGTTDIQIKAIV